MMKFLLVFLVSISVRADQATLTNYYQLRDITIKKFAKDTQLHDVEDHDIILKLEKMLNEILGPSGVAGFSEPGKNNLETLQNDGGFGQADGLRFVAKNEILFVTNKDLLSNFLATQPRLPKDLETLSKTDEFYSKVFSWDAAISHFADIPVKSDAKFMRPFLALTSQDIGPFVPTTLVIFYSAGDRIYAYKSDLKKPIKQIAACKDDWTKTEEKTKREPSNRSAIEERGFLSYKKCYENNVRNESYFDSLKEQAQEVVDRIAKANSHNDRDKSP